MRGQLARQSLVEKPLEQTTLFGNYRQHFNRLFFQVIHQDFFAISFGPEMVAVLQVFEIPLQFPGFFGLAGGEYIAVGEVEDMQL